MGLQIYSPQSSLEIPGGENLQAYPYSSYRFYLGESRPIWVGPEILGSIKDYRSFVEDQPKDTPEFMEDLYLDCLEA